MLLKRLKLNEIINKKKIGYNIYFFGGGQALESFLKWIKRFYLDDIVSGVLDNDAAGYFLPPSKKRLPFMMPSDALKDDVPTVIIITSIKYNKEIEKQLFDMHLSDNFEIVFYGDIIDGLYVDQIKAHYYDCPIVCDENVTIPKVIHYCWFGKKNIPDQYREWMKSWKKYCPDYEIVEWNEDNFDIRSNQYVSEAYDMKKFAFVSDFARLDILYKNGGIYLDTDVEIVKPFDALLHQRGFCGYEGDAFIDTGLATGVYEKNEVIGIWRDDYLTRHFIKDDGKMDLTTCTVRQTQILKKLGFVPDGRFQSVLDMNCYPQTFFQSFLCYGRKPFITKQSFSIHHYAASWH